MIKRLKRRFVVACMTAVTLMLVVTLGIVNAINIYSTMQQTSGLLDRLLRPYVQDGQVYDKPVHQDPFIQPPMEDSARAAVHFFAWVDEKGDLIHMDLDHATALPRSTALDILAQAKEAERGLVQGYRYRSVYDPEDGMTLYLFLDTRVQRYDAVRVLMLSTLAGLGGWIVMFAIVLLLSRQALRPVVAGLEKQKQFVQDAGHEFKTPLAIMQVNLDALELRGGKNKWSANIRQQIGRLNGLTQDMLTLARLEDADQDQRREQIPLGALCQQTLDMFEEPLALRQVTLTRQVADMTVYADPVQIGRLISILLDNAVKYVNDGGAVEFSLTGDRGAVIRVENTCEALPQVPPERLFDRFYRADGARSQTGGYGIGLSAARAIVEAHRGSIEAAYLEGTRIAFTVKL